MTIEEYLVFEIVLLIYSTASKFFFIKSLVQSFICYITTHEICIIKEISSYLHRQLILA